MSANNRSSRHQAVCGSRPGGADAYYLKEACVAKDHSRQQGFYHKKIMRAHAARLGRLLAQVQSTLADIDGPLQGRRVPKRNSHEAYGGVAELMLTSFMRDKTESIDETFETAVNMYNELADARKRRNPTKTATKHAVPKMDLLYYACIMLKAVLEGSINAAKSSAIASNNA